VYAKSPKKKKLETVPPAGKFMGTVFWVSEGCVLVDFLEKGKMIDAACYVETLNEFRCALREERPKKKTVILQHNTARLTLQTVQKNG
jgi:hypothetical protein